MKKFLEELRTQRWTITGSITTAASTSPAFLECHKLPGGLRDDVQGSVIAALIGWLVSMVSRQSGHFFFEPRATTPSTSDP